MLKVILKDVLKSKEIKLKEHFLSINLYIKLPKVILNSLKMINKFLKNKLR